MSPTVSPSQQTDGLGGRPPIECDDCAAALQGDGHRSVGYLILDHLTVPLVGCDDHLGHFSTVCGYTTDAGVRLLDHRPAGGIPCPKCHLAPKQPSHPVFPVRDGAVGVLACPEHQAAIAERFRHGLETQQQLTTSLDTV